MWLVVKRDVKNKAMMNWRPGHGPHLIPYYKSKATQTVSFELLRVRAGLKGSLEECEICRAFTTYPLVRVKPPVSAAETPFHGFSRGTGREI
jgi:hypothetical protein